MLDSDSLSLIFIHPTTDLAWGCGAVGSAREWHSRGRRFNPGQLHQIFLVSSYVPNLPRTKPQRSPVDLLPAVVHTDTEEIVFVTHGSNIRYASH